MGIFSLAVRTTNTTINNPCLEIIAGTSVGYRLLEMGLSPSASSVTDSIIGLGQPQAIGITPTSPVTVLNEDNGSTTAGNTKTALAWATNPTMPVYFFKEYDQQISTAGGGLVWVFPQGGIQVLKNNTLILWNIAASVAMDIWIVVEE